MNAKNPSVHSVDVPTDDPPDPDGGSREHDDEGLEGSAEPPAADADPSGPLPHPLDRVWFHPSELAAFIATQPRPRQRRDWLVLTAVLGVGALILTGLLVGVGSSGGGPGPESIGAGAPLGVAGGPKATARSAVVGIEVATPDHPAPAVVASGVALANDQVLTVATAVAGATAIRVATSGNKTSPAVVLGVDPVTDLALLRVHNATLNPAPVGSADSLDIGSRILAIGAQGWASAGTIVSLRAMTSAPNVGKVGGLLSIDLSAENSADGAAVLDSSGSVVAILTGSERRAGLALPIDVARDIAAQLGFVGRAAHAWLGMTTDDTSDGPTVSAVTRRGPADRARVRRGDVITMAGSEAVFSERDLLAILQRRKPGDPLTLVVRRRGGNVSLDVALGSVPTTTTTTPTTTTTVAPAPPSTTKAKR